MAPASDGVSAPQTVRLPHFPQTGFVRLTSILAPTGPIPVGRSTWWAGVKDGRFPKPVKLGPRTTVWRIEDIRALIERGGRDMTRRPPSWRGVNRHRSYTVDEAARARGVAKGTVRRWLKSGLPAISDRKPLLILGADLAQFLEDRRATKQTGKLNECFCFACRAPRAPAAGMADFVPLSATSGNLRALCCDCAGVMHKRVSLAKLPELQAILDVTIMQAPERIREMTKPSTNDHFPREPEAHA